MRISLISEIGKCPSEKTTLPAHYGNYDIAVNSLCGLYDVANEKKIDGLIKNYASREVLFSKRADNLVDAVEILELLYSKITRLVGLISDLDFGEVYSVLKKNLEFKIDQNDLTYQYPMTCFVYLLREKSLYNLVIVSISNMKYMLSDVDVFSFTGENISKYEKYRTGTGWRSASLDKQLGLYTEASLLPPTAVYYRDHGGFVEPDIWKSNDSLIWINADGTFGIIDSVTQKLNNLTNAPIKSDDDEKPVITTPSVNFQDNKVLEQNTLGFDESDDAYFDIVSDEEYISVNEACARYNIAKNSLYGWKAHGDIRYVQESDKRYRISVNDIEKRLDSNYVPKFNTRSKDSWIIAYSDEMRSYGIPDGTVSAWISKGRLDRVIINGEKCVPKDQFLRLVENRIPRSRRKKYATDK